MLREDDAWVIPLVDPPGEVAFSNNGEADVAVGGGNGFLEVGSLHSVLDAVLFK